MFCFPKSISGACDVAGGERTLDIDVPYPTLETCKSYFRCTREELLKLLAVIMSVVQEVVDEWRLWCGKGRSHGTTPDVGLDLFHAHGCGLWTVIAKEGVVQWRSEEGVGRKFIHENCDGGNSPLAMTDATVGEYLEE